MNLTLPSDDDFEMTLGGDLDYDSAFGRYICRSPFSYSEVHRNFSSWNSVLHNLTIKVDSFSLCNPK